MTGRLPIAFVLALVVTGAIFWFMQYLIQGRGETTAITRVAGMVELYRPEPPQQSEPLVRPDIEQQRVQQEPSMDKLAVEAPAALPGIKQSSVLPSFSGLELPVGAGGGGQFDLVGKGTDLLRQLGEDASGYIEVVPYTTRRPNIPELAWRKKVNGWVLVAFKVDTDGKVSDVRVLDANPRGLFEANVVAAVRDWRYVVKGAKPQGDLLLTQKVELFWKDYPNNADWLD